MDMGSRVTSLAVFIQKSSKTVSDVRKWGAGVTSLLEAEGRLSHRPEGGGLGVG